MDSSEVRDTVIVEVLNNTPLLTTVCSRLLTSSGHAQYGQPFIVFVQHQLFEQLSRFLLRDIPFSLPARIAVFKHTLVRERLLTLYEQHTKNVFDGLQFTDALVPAMREKELQERRHQVLAHLHCDVCKIERCVTQLVDLLIEQETGNSAAWQLWRTAADNSTVQADLIKHMENFLIAAQQNSALKVDLLVLREIDNFEQILLTELLKHDTATLLTRLYRQLAVVSQAESKQIIEHAFSNGVYAQIWQQVFQDICNRCEETLYAYDNKFEQVLGQQFS